MLRPAIATLKRLRRRSTICFIYAEHGCAFGYAVCEFGNFHFFLVLVSAGLLLGATLLLLVTLLELL